MFLEYFDVQGRKLKDFSQDKDNMKSFKLKKSVEVDIFNENAVIIFVTLLKPLGYVKRTTNSFTKIFGYPREHIINNSCNLIMPTHIGLIHDRFLY